MSVRIRIRLECISRPRVLAQSHWLARSALTSSRRFMAQAINTPLTRSTLFLTLNLTDQPDAVITVRTVLASIPDLVKTVGTRDLDSHLSCVAGIGSRAWDRIMDKIPRPTELHALPVITGQTHKTVSTSEDLLFHVKAERKDLGFEFERQLLDQLGSAVKVFDETWGFRYFDARDLLGFVDGTANPQGKAADESTMVEEADDPLHARGSYIVTQKYLHDLDAWDRVGVEQQQLIVGRTKLDNIELDDAASTAQKSHKTLATVTDADGNEHDILRGNMPFGSPATRKFGTYFIGYSKQLWVMEKMLERMFVGDPPGKHDRILDYSRPVTGATFFAPSADMLSEIA